MNPCSPRARFSRCSGALLGLVALLGVSLASAEPQEKRIYMIGNSLTDQVQYANFQKLAESRGHKHVWGRSMTPGAPINWHWDNKPAFTQAPFGDFRKALTEYEWDAVTLQPFASYERELNAAKKMLDLMKPKNVGAQVYIYSQWMGTSNGDFDRLFTQRLDKPTGSTVGIRQFYEVFIQELAAANPDMKTPRLIPAGHAIYLFNQKIQAGLVPGYTSIWQLYNDGIHLGNVGSYFVACSFYATIYGESPVGLPFADYNEDLHGRADRTLTPALARLVQETVWETVTGHAALTGVSAADTAPAVASPRLAPAVQSSPYSFQLLGAFGEPPLTWKLAAGRLPEGFTLSPEGLLTGTAGQPGTLKLAFAVADARGRQAQRELALVTEADIAPVIVDEKLPAAPVGKYLEYAIKSQGGNGTLTWVVTKKGGLPPGLALANNGTLLGTPVKAGQYTFDVEARDGDPASPDVVTKTLSMAIGPGAADLVYIDTVPNGTIKADGALDEAAWKLDQKIQKLVEGQPTGVSGRFGVLAVGDGLVIGVDVTDPEIAENASDLAAGDSVDVYLDLYNNRETTYNADDRRITVSPSGKLAVVGNRRVLGAKAKRTPTGYSVEVSLPGYNLQVGLKAAAIGVDVGINDVKAGKRTRLVWHGTAKNDTDPSQFGTMIVIAPEPAPKTPAAPAAK